MTLRQEAYQKMQMLPDSSVRLVISLLDEMLHLTSIQPLKQTKQLQKQAAFQEMMEMREQYQFPDDFDYSRAREDGMREKYGDFM